MTCHYLLLLICTKGCTDLKKVEFHQYFAHPDAHVLEEMHELAELKPFLQVSQLACTHDALQAL